MSAETLAMPGDGGGVPVIVRDKAGRFANSESARAAVEWRKQKGGKWRAGRTPQRFWQVLRKVMKVHEFLDTPMESYEHRTLMELVRDRCARTVVEGQEAPAATVMGFLLRLKYAPAALEEKAVDSTHHDLDRELTEKDVQEAKEYLKRLG